MAIFESKSGSRERRAIWQNIVNNLNNCEEFVVTARRLRNHFATLMKRYKSKTIQELKKTGLGSEELSENEQLLGNLIEILKKSERRTKADTQKGQSYIYISRNEKKKQWKDLGRQENIRGKMKVTLEIKTK